jgi:hypothetical protein
MMFTANESPTIERTTVKQACAVLIVLFVLASSGRAQKVSTDREAAGLKGQVQKIVTEEADLSTVNGNVVEGERRVSAIETYDAAGNALEKQRYIKGRLFETMIYSFLDG